MPNPKHTLEKIEVKFYDEYGIVEENTINPDLIYEHAIKNENVIDTMGQITTKMRKRHDDLTNKEKWVCKIIGNLIMIVITLIIFWHYMPPYFKTWWLG